jgi:hypothetical protein
MGPDGVETKKCCAGEGQKKFTGINSQSCEIEKYGNESGRT